MVKTTAAKKGAGKAKKTTDASANGGSAISKKLGWVNKMLITRISYNEVVDVLNGVGEETACELLDELSGKAMTIKDPTSWLMSACNNAATGVKKDNRKGGVQTFKGSDKVCKTIGWLNKHGGLSQPIVYDGVKMALSSVGDGVAGKLLHELAEGGQEVKDPTRWLLSAAMRAGGGKGGGKGGAGKGGAGLAWMSMWAGAGTGGKKVSQRIGWLNKNLALETPITYNEVSGPLSMMSEGDACKLLKEFEEKASEIRDPTRWIVKAAGRMVHC